VRPGFPAHIFLKNSKFRVDMAKKSEPSFLFFSNQIKYYKSNLN